MSDKFYESVLSKLLSSGLVTLEMKILVLCGGSRDRDALAFHGFEKVTISNLGDCSEGERYLPFHWSSQDAENLSYPDKSFDFVCVHSGLHHCASPHRALLEMYRVAKVGVLVVEARDSLLMRLGRSLNLTPEYEVEAVVGNKFISGGLRNSQIPNYIYRWTEREVEKTIQTFAPYAKHELKFWYGMHLPTERLQMQRKGASLNLLRLLTPIMWILNLTLPRQLNRFAFFVRKPSLPKELFPWLQGPEGNLRFNVDWAQSKYR